MKYSIREIKNTEYSILKDFLYEAIYIPTGYKKPDRSIINNEGLNVYIDSFGSFETDRCLIALVDEKPIGAVWVRIMNDYGHIDNNTLSLAISLYEEYRGNGIGAALMNEMIILLNKLGYKRISLSVQKENYAYKLYKKLGFQIYKELETEFIMLLDMERK